MRKLFSFRSSTSSNVINDRAPPPAPLDNEEVYWEAPFKFGDNTQLSKTLKQIPETQNLGPCTGLRRSLSFSSASCIGSPRNDRNVHAQSDDILVGCRSLTPDRQFNAKRGEGLAARKRYGMQKAESPCSSNSIDSTRESPQANSARLVHVSNNVLDLYIDGEQNQDMSLRTRSSSFRCQSNIGVGGRRPPRIQTTAPVSPTDMRKDKGRSQSFRDNHLMLSTREWKRAEFGSESPQKLARNVVERLSQVFPHKPKTRSRDLDPDTPTTVEDIFESFVDPNTSSYSDVITQKNCVSDIPYGAMIGYVGEGGKDFSDERFSVPDASLSMDLAMEDVELRKYADEAQERVMFISEEIEQDILLRSRDFSVSELFQTIRSLSEEKRSLAVEVLTQIQCRISERESAREARRGAMVEIDSRIRRLEREKNELQTTLEQELDRRSNDWSFKLEKYHSEEQRLRERVRELAEQNVSLQREVSSFNVKEAENRNQMASAEVQLKDLTAKLKETTKENCALQQNLSKLHDQCKGAENDRDCIRQSYKETEKESKELQKTLARLQRTCSEQERTIKGLRQGLAEDIERKEPFDYDANRWKMEQVRLTGVEQVLRREVESNRLEVESIRRENMNLLDRLNNSGIEGGSSGFRLEQELKDRISCLQKQGLSLFGESCQMCEKLLRFFNGKTEKSAGQIQEVGKDKFDGYFIVEANMKVQNMKRGIENLTRNLQSISLVLEEKSKRDPLSTHTENGSSGKLKDKASEDDIAFKLKAETFLTTLLRENLLSKQQEVEQLQAEVATAARGHDILRSEVQGALDSLSRASHKMKDLELKMMKKEDSIHQLTSELQQCEKELASIKGVLSKMTEERDLCWEEVKNYSEKNMLLNSEVNMLRKKVESLDEDVHIKEGQITILRDSLGNRKPFDILYSPNNSMQDIEHFLG